MAVLGIDIGGSGIKGRLVDPTSGELVSDRFKILTPQPSTPDAVAGVVFKMVRHFEYGGPVGCTFPAIVKNGVTLSAANVDPAWIGTDAASLFRDKTSLPFTVLNDADAAGIAEMAHGAGRGHTGVVMLLTFGTGIGSALFVDGRLLPNTELGHLHFAGLESVEDWAAASVKKAEKLSWKKWTLRVNDYLAHLDKLFSPDLFILGGGVSRKMEQWERWLKTPVELVPAQLANDAGIVGAAMAAAYSD